ncbi:MAG TPA: hypothetical protein VFZ66_28300 [Herpetosiphonaceae bacterium]
MSDMLRAEDLQREIDAAAAQAGPEPSFPQLELQQLLPLLREHHMVEPRPPLIGRTAYERLWVRINRVVRRIAAHAVEPAVTQQNEFNRTLLETLEGLIQADAALRGAVVAARAAQAARDRDGAHERD